MLLKIIFSYYREYSQILLDKAVFSILNDGYFYASYIRHTFLKSELYSLKAIVFFLLFLMVAIFMEFFKGFRAWHELIFTTF